MPIKLIVGLGNPGKKYENTRHNAGFWLLERLAAQYRVSLRTEAQFLALTATLIAYHAWCGKLMLDFRANRNTKSHVWFRWFNEFPTVVLFAAVFLVVFKPT